MAMTPEWFSIIFIVCILIAEFAEIKYAAFRFMFQSKYVYLPHRLLLQFIGLPQFHFVKMDHFHGDVPANMQRADKAEAPD